MIVTIEADAECAGLASLLLATFEGIDQLETAEARMLAARAVYWTAEDAANTLTATPEQIEAWQSTMTVFEAARGEVETIRARLASL